MDPAEQQQQSVETSSTFPDLCLAIYQWKINPLRGTSGHYRYVPAKLYVQNNRCATETKGIILIGCNTMHVVHDKDIGIPRSVTLEILYRS